ncbi:hypothetical protein IGI04_040919 [Brassica rapa subsp. trilocularis]|uniref:CCHC-type domain-containing protein n=1 Tax=Brassica rapa subsp. trilocularis TaxID=1813537 RepID=A0ABQ7KPX4_BRACM|nr:hypothetical protein IGI04_040919 [Brassica rapa subsp. trilocularis]
MSHDSCNIPGPAQKGTQVQEAQEEETLDITPPIAYKRRSSPKVQPQERQQAKPCPSRTPPPPPPQAAAAPSPTKPAASRPRSPSRRDRAPSRRLHPKPISLLCDSDSQTRSREVTVSPNLDPDLLLQKAKVWPRGSGSRCPYGASVFSSLSFWTLFTFNHFLLSFIRHSYLIRFIGPRPLQLLSEPVKPTRCCPGMPPKNARVARPAAANQRATRRVTRSASQASSEAESRREGAPENENPVEMPNVANAALLAELQRYRDAYGGQLPNVELRNICNVRDYRDVHELIEKAAEQESGLEEERKQNQNSQNRGAKRPRDAQPAAEPAPLRPACERCGRFHAGECRMGACFACGERGHIAKDCPKERLGQRRRCYRCGQEGHLSWECPTLQRGNAEGAQPQQQRGQAAGARAYAVEGREGAEPIAGSVAVGGVTAFTLFDTGATHSFVSPRLTREWDFKGNFNTMVTGVETAGTEKMATRGRYEEVPVILAGVNLPGDLLELELGRYEVILGMDWLAQHRAVVECAKACVRIPLDGRQIVYRGMRTRTGITVVRSSPRVQPQERQQAKPCPSRTPPPPPPQAAAAREALAAATELLAAASLIQFHPDLLLQKAKVWPRGSGSRCPYGASVFSSLSFWTLFTFNHFLLSFIRHSVWVKVFDKVHRAKAVTTHIYMLSVL